MRSSNLIFSCPAAVEDAAARWAFGQHGSPVTARPTGAPALQWRFRRNCSITPNQLLAVYGGLCIVTLGIALSFAWQGAPFVLLFAGLELFVLGAALLVFARHAGDRETLTLSGRSLQVEQRIGTRVVRTDFAAEWLSVEPAGGQGSLLQLSGEGRSVRVGRFLRPEKRLALARDLRRALRGSPGGAARSGGPAGELS